MNSDADSISITDVFRRFRQGDESAAKHLWREFFPRLIGVARKALKGYELRVTDPDDAVQSAFLSFWNQLERGRLDGEMHRDNLWNLLATITVRKALNRARNEHAAKRGGGRRREFDDANISAAHADIATNLASMSAQEFDVFSEELLLLLDEQHRHVALLKLVGHTNDEIAEVLDCTRRTVSRRLHLIRLTWEPEINSQD